MKSNSAAHWAAHLTESASLPVGARLSHLRAAANLLGCTVEHRSMPGESGRFFQDDDGDHIWLTAEASYRRSRFTLAHELGHLTVAQNGLTVTNEEPWCNAFAAELLMPAATMRRAAHNAGDLNLAAVTDIAETYRVTTAAAVVRMNKLGLTDLATMTFRRVNDRWALFSTFCLPRNVGSSLRSATGTSRALDRFKPDRRYTTIRIPMRIAGAQGELEVSATREGKYITVAVRRTEFDRIVRAAS